MEEEKRFEENELNKDDFIEQICKYGYFPEQIPECFNTNAFIEKLNDLLEITYTNNTKIITQCTDLSIYKDDLSRRIISLPNPKSFLRLVKYMYEHFDEIKEFAHSKNSLSPINRFSDYNGDMKNFLNIENLKDDNIIKSDFIENIRTNIKISLGYKYCLKLDIANCYNSIYTHSISWAVCGKEDSKKYLIIVNQNKKKNKNKVEIKLPEEVMKKCEICNNLDKYIRELNFNETSGIITGPFTSRIFSEIILSGIDKELDNKGFVFKRYVDDYRFYFKTKLDAENSLSSIIAILRKYKFNINESKTDILEYPFNMLSDLKAKFKNAMEENGIFEVLNTANNLYDAGEKGAYKYALKIIKDKDVIIDFDVILPTLINIMTVNYRYGKYILPFLEKNIDKLDKNEFSEIINSELSNAIKKGYQQESLMFLSFIKKLKLKITSDNLINVLKNGDDFSIIIALDIIKNCKNLIDFGTNCIIKVYREVVKLKKNLKSENYDGARWLLIYEIQRHKLISRFNIKINDEFFNKMNNLNISFYEE